MQRYSSTVSYPSSPKSDTNGKQNAGLRFSHRLAALLGVLCNWSFLSIRCWFALSQGWLKVSEAASSSLSFLAQRRCAPAELPAEKQVFAAAFTWNKETVPKIFYVSVPTRKFGWYYSNYQQHLRNARLCCPHTPWEGSRCSFPCYWSSRSVYVQFLLF